MTTARRSQSDPKSNAIRELAEKHQLAEEVQAALLVAVQDAKDAGCSWAEIAVATGLGSKQAAFDKWAKRIGGQDA